MASEVPSPLREGRRVSPFAFILPYLVAVAAVSAATVVRAALAPKLGYHAPYLPFLLAIVVSARFAGRAPALAASALSALVIAWLFLPPLGSFAVSDPTAILGLALFIAIAVTCSVLVSSLRNSLLATARAEERLRRQTELVELSHDAIITADADRRITGWNAGAEELYGWSSAEAVGHVVHELLQTTTDLQTAGVDETLRTRGRWEGELNHIARDGSRLCVESRQVQILDRDGRPAGILEINRDITEKSRAQQESREAQQRLVLAQKAGRAGSFDWDATSNVNVWSDELLDLYGFQPGEFGGTSQDWVDCLVPEDRAAGVAAIQKSLETGVFELEFRIHRRDTGEVRWMYGRADVSYDESGRPARMVGINLDITGRKQAEEALRESQAKWEAAMASMSDAVCISDPQGHLVDFNDAFVAFHRFLSREACAKAFAEDAQILELSLPDGTPAPPGQWAMPRALRGEKGSNAEYTLRRTDTGETWVGSYTFSPIRDSRGEIVGSVVVARDVTEAKQAEQALRASERRYSALFANQINAIAHCKVITDSAGQPVDYEMLQVNDAYERVTGLHRAQVEGRRARERFPGIENSPFDFIGQYGAVALHGGELSFEVFFEALSRWFSVYAYSPTRGEFVAIFTDVTDRKRAEEALHTSEAKMRAVFHALAEGVVYFNAEGQVEEANDAVLETYGLTLLQLRDPARDPRFHIRRPDGEPFPVNEQPAILALRTGQAVRDVELGIPTPAGDIRWLLVNAQPVRDDDGSLLGAVASFFDITDRRYAEERLRQSESFYRQTLESIPGMVFTATPDGYFDYVSQQWVDYTGVPVPEHLGGGWADRLHPDDRSPAHSAWRTAVEARTAYDLEYRVKRHDGVFEWFKVIGSPIVDAGGAIVRWFGVALNIESLKTAEQDLRQALEQRKLALEAADLGAWDHHLDTGEVFWDERSQRIFGAPGEDRPDYHAAIARIHPEDRATANEVFERAMAGANGGICHQEFRVVLSDGSVRWVAAHGRVFFESDGGQPRPARFVGVNMDITDRKEAEDRFRRAQKLESIGLLAGGVAHDFNNLLTVILGSASAALQECSSCEHTRAIVSAAERAAHLTRQLLAYAGKGHFISRTLDLNETIVRSRQLLEASVPKRAELVFHLGDALPCLEDDPGRLEQILMNLVINAGEAIPPKTDGRIEIATGTVELTPEMTRQSRSELLPGRYVWLEVRDNGIGMDEATVSRVFDPFFSTKFTGRGLGLAAVDGIVRSAKGSIDVRSLPGGGSTFRVLLPASEKALAPVITPPAALKAPAPALTILVVDDEEMVRKLASMILRRHGYEVVEATDGKHALELVSSSHPPPAVALLDLAMPVMGGDELIPVLAERFPEIKVILSSGYPEEDARKRFNGGHVTAFLQKPYTAAGLTGKVREILGPGRQPPPDLLQLPEST